MLRTRYAKPQGKQTHMSRLPVRGSLRTIPATLDSPAWQDASVQTQTSLACAAACVHGAALRNRRAPHAGTQ